MNALFGIKQKTEKEKDADVKQWLRQLKREERKMERAVKKIERDMKSLEKELKKEAKSPNTTKAAIKAYAKSLCVQKTHRNRMILQRTQIHSAGLQIKEMQASIKMGQAMKHQAQITATMNGLMKIDSMQQTARQMQQEMTKFGIMQEMTDDIMEEMDDVSEEEVQDEVDKVVMELTGLKLEEIGVIEGKKVKQETVEEEEEEEKFAARLAAI